PAILVQFVAASICDGLDAAFHRNATRRAQQVQRFLIPQINPGLQADSYRSAAQFLQQPANGFSHSDNLVNPVDVIHSTRNQGINFAEDHIQTPLAKLIAEECLVAEATRPRTAAGEFQLGDSARAMENMMTMLVPFDVIVFETQCVEL